MEKLDLTAEIIIFQNPIPLRNCSRANVQMCFLSSGILSATLLAMPRTAHQRSKVTVQLPFHKQLLLKGFWLLDVSSDQGPPRVQS